MQSSILNHKFLLDENVHRKLYKFLLGKNYNVKIAQRAASDIRIAALSNIEKRIVITNDDDFMEFTQDEVYSVILLKIPQGNAEILIKSFEKVVKECKHFSGKLIIVKINTWEEFTLGIEI